MRLLATQFAIGIPLGGALSHEGVSSRDTSIDPTPPIGGIWPNSQLRYKLRSRAPGILRAETIWGDAARQAQLGCLSPPLPIDLGNSVATYERESVNIALRFGAGQADKLRAFVDLKHNEADL